MDGISEGTPLHPTAEGGVSAASPDDYKMWLITGRFDGVLLSGRQHFAENLHLETSRMFSGRCTFTGSEHEYHLLIQATDEEVGVYLEFYKRTVEIWGADIRLSYKMTIDEVRPV